MQHARLAEDPRRALLAALGGDAAGIAVATSGSSGAPREVLIGPDAVVALGGMGAFVPPDSVERVIDLATGPVVLTHPLDGDPSHWLPRDVAPDFANDSREATALSVSACGGDLYEVGGLQVAVIAAPVA